MGPGLQRSIDLLRLRPAGKLPSLRGRWTSGRPDVGPIAGAPARSGNRWNDGRMARPDPAYQAVIVAAQSGQAVSVARDELVRVVDVDGHQVGDIWAIDAADPGLWLSTGH